MKRILINVGLALFLGATLLSTPALGANAQPTVLPPNHNAYGMSYSQWSARWWQWVTSMSLDNHPLADTADCSRGQFGKVWFLGGSFTPTGGKRLCTVPKGKALFFPIVNADCSSLETGDFYGGTPWARRACAMGIVDHVVDMATEIDGVPVENLTTYRTTSPNLVFAIAPRDNVLGIDAGTGELVADGYYLMVAPLPKGQHTIHFKGTFSQWGATVEETYTLTVGP